MYQNHLKILCQIKYISWKTKKLLRWVKRIFRKKQILFADNSRKKYFAKNLIKEKYELIIIDGLGVRKG